MAVWAGTKVQTGIIAGASAGTMVGASAGTDTHGKQLTWETWESSGMKQSDRLVLGAILIFLLVMTTYTSNLLIISNNRPLFAQIRVLVHGRTSTRQLIVDQNIKSENISTNRTGIIQKNSLPTSRALNVTALNLPINGTTKINPENGNADVQYYRVNWCWRR